MKVKCWCGRIGHLEKRGKNSYRIKHFMGYDPNTRKRKYVNHRVSVEYLENMGIIGNHVKTLNPSPNTELNMRGYPSLVGGRPAKPVARWASRVQIPHPAPKTSLFSRVFFWL